MARGSNPAATAAPTPMNAQMPMAGQSPMPSAINPAAANNVFMQASGALTDAMGGTRNIMGFQGQQVGTQFGYDPQQVAAQQAVGGIDTYMNPYTQQVIDTSMNDLERQRQMQMNQLGAQASAAGAFGGSRQGVAESLTNEAFARQGGELAAGLRQQGFQTALGASQQDVTNQMQAALANQGAFGRAQEFGQGMTLDAQQANQQAAQQAANLRLQASGQLGGLGQTGFGMGQGIIGMQQQQGLLQQQNNQRLIDAARAQYGGFANAPQTALNTRMGAASAGNFNQGSTTQTRNPGLFDYLQAGAQAGATYASSDRRLKTNVTQIGERSGVKIYSWDWTDEGKRIASPDQPTVGVMADELMETHPHLVHRASDGYLRVNYGGLNI